jgi:hypothetical protein
MQVLFLIFDKRRWGDFPSSSLPLSLRPTKAQSRISNTELTGEDVRKKKEEAWRIRFTSLDKTDRRHRWWVHGQNTQSTGILLSENEQKKMYALDSTAAFFFQGRVQIQLSSLLYQLNRCQ